MRRTLSLKRETLTSLTTAEMAAFGGAGNQEPTTQEHAPTLPLADCFGTLQNSKLVCTGTTCNC